MRMVDRGVIHGRFQVLHNDHLSYLLAGKSRCRDLVVGITNPDPVLTRDDPADPNRSSPLANPLTYFERYTLVREVLLGAGLHYAEFSVVPFPVNLPALYRYYLPLDATFFLTIYDEWGKRKREQFKAAGLKTEVLWTRDPESKGQSAGEIRRRMAFGEAWEQLVPKETAILIKRWRVPERLRILYEMDAAGSFSCD
jgi:nicotinamide mononucleotide adenylyltransferase